MASPSSSRFSLCVFCGSRAGNDPAFAQAAKAIGEWLGRNEGQLVYGGGRSGLMGMVADAALEAGAPVIGIIPKSLVEREFAHTGCTELHVVDTMHERKQMMSDRANAYAALPGGIGTFEELFEVWTWRQLGYHSKPIGMLNINGYYDNLQLFFQSALRAGLMDPWQMDLMQWGTRIEPLLDSLKQSINVNAPTPDRRTP